jgi:methionyl-tRNA synthetase
VILSTYDEGALHTSFGIDLGEIDMAAVESLGVGANWGRVGAGRHSDPHQHDETETFVIVAGHGDLVVDAKRTPVSPGMVIQFEPFETHYLDNPGPEDLLFVTFYWRDAPRASRLAARGDRRRFADRPIFAFSTPPTPNGALHIGHLSGPYLATDAFVRFQRMNGRTVWHLAATDDHQSYVAECASREGRPPAEVAAHYAQEIAQTLALMDIEPDQVVHTSRDERYQQALQAFFARIAASGLVAPASGPALFDGRTGQYLYEPWVHGGCPACGSATGGNICEECGEPNSCVDLVDPRPAGPADADGAAPRVAAITRYTLPLHELRASVLEHHKVGRVPARARELANRVFARERVDVALTHPSSWGVPPPREQAGAVPGQVMWVWIELAFGFLYGIESLGRRLGTGWRADAPADDWKIVHFLGYDNTFYHSILSPALYKLASPAWTPDIDYHVNEFYLLDGDKFSTSRRHAIWGKDVLGPDTVDAIRFYLALTRPETRRTNFTLSGYEQAVTGTLIGTWQRWLNDLGARVAKHYGGTAPDAGIWTPEHAAFLGRLEARLAEMAVSLGQDGFSLNQAARTLTGIVEDTVRFSRAEAAVAGAPQWRDETRTAIALELAAASLLATCAAPVMPRFAGRLARSLGLGGDDSAPRQWPAHVTLVPAGSPVDLAGHVFFTAPQPPPEAASPPEPELPARHDREATGQAPGGTGGRPPGGDWLDGLVRQTLQLPAGASIGDATLVSLGAESMQAIAIQYQILARTGADVAMEDLLGDHTVAQLAAMLPAAAEEGATA